MKASRSSVRRRRGIHSPVDPLSQPVHAHRGPVRVRRITECLPSQPGNRIELRLRIRVERGHVHQPPSLEEYLQEIGRAGRDGEPATALLLASEPTGWLEPTDRALARHFRTQQQVNCQQAENALTRLPERGTCTKANALSLALLHERGLLTWETPFEYRLLGGSTQAAVQCGSLFRAHLLTNRCRWQFLLRAFGFEGHPACGRCDRSDRCSR